CGGSAPAQRVARGVCARTGSVRAQRRADSLGDRATHPEGGGRCALVRALNVSGDEACLPREPVNPGSPATRSRLRRTWRAVASSPPARGWRCRRPTRGTITYVAALAAGIGIDRDLRTGVERGLAAACAW